MNRLPVETRIDILAGAVSDLAYAIELLLDRLPSPVRDEPDFSAIIDAYEAARKRAERCMEV